MPGGPKGSEYGPQRPTMWLYGIPKHETYRRKLERKWLRKGYNARFG